MYICMYVYIFLVRGTRGRGVKEHAAHPVLAANGTPERPKRLAKGECLRFRGGRGRR